MKLIGVDIGGTFTDLILSDTDKQKTWIHKVPTTDDPSVGMVEGIQQLCHMSGTSPKDVDHVLHGTTIATNALLQYDGAKTGLITTKNYRDILHLARHQRPLHYSLKQEIPWQDRPLVRRRYRKTVTERLGPKGEVLIPLNVEEARRAAEELREAGVESVVICFLFSYVNEAHEEQVREIVEEIHPEAFITTSSSIFPQFREYERFSTAAISGFVGPKVKNYLNNLTTSLANTGIKTELHMMRSNGGVVTSRTATEKPATLLLSGPAAGVLGGRWIGQLSRRENLITFDMGGTSADIGIVTPRGIIEASARDTWVAGYPVMVPMIDVHTIGAGGGSIAYVDPGGAFLVGPKSAGANPGPACYGLGGRQPTVTDANVVLNRLDQDYFLGGEMTIHPEKSEQAMSELAQKLNLDLYEAAEGVITIVNHNMANAIRSRTIQKGHDPREFSLVAFGGAGPLHAVEVALELGIPEVIVPAYPGITSAVGLLTTDLKYDLIRNQFMLNANPDLDKLNNDLVALEAEVREQLHKDGVSDEDITIFRGADCRYVGQGYELRVAFAEGGLDEAKLQQTWQSFHDLHRTEYGHYFPNNPIELVNLRVIGTGAMPKLSGDHLAKGGNLDEARLKYIQTYFRRAGNLEQHKTAVYLRDKLPVAETIAGPALIAQKDSTTLLPPDSQGVLQDNGNIVISVQNTTKGEAR